MCGASVRRGAPEWQWASKIMDFLLKALNNTSRICFYLDVFAKTL